MSAPATRVAVLISGEGSNLQALLDSAHAGRLGARIVVVVSNRGTARGLQRARESGVPAVHVPAAKGMAREDYDAALDSALRGYEPAIIVLAGFMRILSANFVEQRLGRILNIHPSLLPAYPGVDTHRRVLEAGERWHGATVHFVTPELDAGPAIIQYRIPIRSGDSPESLARRVHGGEHVILPRAVTWLAAGRLRLEEESVMLDGQPLRGPVVVEEAE